MCDRIASVPVSPFCFCQNWSHIIFTGIAGSEKLLIRYQYWSIEKTVEEAFKIHKITICYSKLVLYKLRSEYVCKTVNADLDFWFWAFYSLATVSCSIIPKNKTKIKPLFTFFSTVFVRGKGRKQNQHPASTI